MTSVSRARRQPFRRLPLLVATGILVNGIRLRGRVRNLAVLTPTQEPVTPTHRFLTAAGVMLDEATRCAASAHARREGLEVLDLIPADLPVDLAMDLGRRYNPATFRSDTFAPARGACHALLVDADVLERTDITRVDGLDPAELGQVTMRLKQYAATTTDAAVAPGLQALPDAIGVQRAWLQAVKAQPASVPEALGAFTGPPLTCAALAVAAVLGGPHRWGAAAVVAFYLQPYLTFAGSGLLAPRDLSARTLLDRPWRRPARWARALSGPAPQRSDSGPDRMDQLRPAYAADLAGGTERFFELRRETCPWCGSAELSVRVTMPDLLQHKPGRFTLEQCHACGHVFQNPRLTPAGLEFYYRDFYDGLGGPAIEQGFALQKRTYQDRARMLALYATPASWLDVGAGHGHFCNAAREVWRQTVFDGLDLADGIEEAERRRWVRRGYRGMFPDLADELAGRYDVVSMFHYLEHTRDPFAEIDAAAKVLPVGGHLLIELPNPESGFARLLGRWWMPWLQPQHQHMIRIDNLVQALADRGFGTVAVHRGQANQEGYDLTMGLILVLNSVTYDPSLPWVPQTRLRTSRSFRRAQLALLAAATPVGLAAWFADAVCHQVIRHRHAGGNAYRVLARKES